MKDEKGKAGSAGQNSVMKTELIKCVGNKLIIDLEAQSPMIHFQGEQRGATLRASEVKPKLDRFLRRKLGDTEIPEKWKLEVKDNNNNKTNNNTETFALNYKMRFESAHEKDNNGSSKNSIEKYKIYYGKEHKKVFWTNPQMIIFSMHSDLLKTIEVHIKEFFCVHNFGTMQNKGFGSFLVQGSYNNCLSDDNIKEIAALFKEELAVSSGNKKRVYYMDNLEKWSKNPARIHTFNRIKKFHRLLKSGDNPEEGTYVKSYLFKYMFKKKIGNEKACLKQQGVAPIVSNKGIDFPREDAVNPRFVRALLGLPGNYLFLITEANFKDRVNISISHAEKDDEKKIERMPSPLFYKIIKDVLFIVPKKIPDEIFDKSFRFKVKKLSQNACAASRTWYSGHQGNYKDIKTPSANEFKLADFMESFAQQKADKNIKYVEFLDKREETSK